MSRVTRRALESAARAAMPPAALELLLRVVRPRRFFSGPIACWPAGSTYGGDNRHIGLARSERSTDQSTLAEQPLVTVRAVTALLAAIADATTDGSICRIVDFGGGLEAPMYGIVRSLLPPSISLDWRVVELADVVAAARPGPETSWVTHADAPTDTDVVVTDAAIQYVEHPLELITWFGTLRPKTIVVNRLPCTDSQPFILEQRMPVRRSAHTFPMNVVSKIDLERTVLAMGYQISATWIGGPGYRIRYGARASDVFGFVIARCDNR